MAFVGRERELAELAEALQRATDGALTRVVLAGPAGIGISSLLDELQRRLSDLPGMVLARGRATEPDALRPYAAVVEALEGALSALPDERFATVTGPAAHDLVALIPSLADRLDGLGIARQAPDLEAPDQVGSRVAESIRGTLARLATGGVLLLALEDLHWADPATRRLVASLQDTHLPAPVCLLVTFQPEALHRRHPARDLLWGLRRAGDTTVLEPAPLTPDELADLCAALEDERPSGSFLAALSEGSGGVPLQAVQLITARGALEGLRLSDPFVDVLGARLDALSAGALQTLRLLAAARRPLPRATCLALALPDGHLSARSITEAIASGLLIEDASSGDLGIAHELYAEGIEDLALAPERHACHAALADAEPSPAVAAWHWAAASRPAATRAAHLAAGHDAERLDPGETALAHFQAALELADPETHPTAAAPGLSAVLVAAARAAAVSGSFRRAAALTRRAIDARPRAGRRKEGAGAGQSVTGGQREDRVAAALELGELYVQLGRYRWDGGDLVGGMEALQQALEIIPPGPGPGRARALGVLAQHLMIDGQFEESAALAEQARALAIGGIRPALAEAGHATCTLGVDTAYLGDLDRGLALLEEATDLARRSGRLDHLMRAYANRTTLLDLDSRREQALAVVKEGIRDARASGLGDTYGAFLRGNAADILFMLGRWPEAEVECRAALAGRPAGVAWFSPILYLGLVLVESRADEEAARLVGRTLLQLEQVPAGQWTALVLRAAVSLMLWSGQVDDAVAVAGAAWERVMETDDAGQIAMSASTCLEAAAASADAARMARDFGTLGTAGELAARVLSEAERAVAAGTLQSSLGARQEAELHLEMARAHLVRVRGGRSTSRWARLAERWASIPVPYQAAKARWWQALAVLEKGDGRVAAREPLLEAWRIASNLPAEPLRRALADVARRARIQLPGASGADLRPRIAVPVVATTAADAVAGSVTVADHRLVAMGPGPASGRPDTAGAIARRMEAGRGSSSGTFFGLSPRELEVLRVLMEGRTNREIAERLFISDRTVGVHVRRILAKLGASGRVEAAGIAIRSGVEPGSRARGRAPAGTHSG